MPPIEEAKRLLVHYFRMVATAAGVDWGSDNDAEVGNIVDYLADAIKQESARAAGSTNLKTEGIMPKALYTISEVAEWLHTNTRQATAIINDSFEPGAEKFDEYHVTGTETVSRATLSALVANGGYVGRRIAQLLGK